MAFLLPFIAPLINLGSAAYSTYEAAEAYKQGDTTQKKISNAVISFLTMGIVSDGYNLYSQPKWKENTPEENARIEEAFWKWYYSPQQTSIRASQEQRQETLNVINRSKAQLAAKTSNKELGRQIQEAKLKSQKEGQEYVQDQIKKAQEQASKIVQTNVEDKTKQAIEDAKNNFINKNQTKQQEQLDKLSKINSDTTANLNKAIDDKEVSKAVATQAVNEYIDKTQNIKQQNQQVLQQSLAKDLEQKQKREAILSQQPQQQQVIPTKVIPASVSTRSLRGRGQNDLMLHAIVVHKPATKEDALRISNDITKQRKKKRFIRETEQSYRVRIVPKTKFKHFVSKVINPSVTLVFGY